MSSEGCIAVVRRVHSNLVITGLKINFGKTTSFHITRQVIHPRSELGTCQGLSPGSITNYHPSQVVPLVKTQSHLSFSH